MIATRILIVDDAERVRQDLCQMLCMFAGLEVVGQAQDGLQAVQQAQEHLPDVILLDLEMPGMDGYTAARRIKSMFPQCRVIAFTVHGYEEARKKAFQSGVDAFIVKGEPVENLVRVISEKGVSHANPKAL